MINKIFMGTFILSSFALGNSHLNYDIKIKEKNTLVIGIVKGDSSNSKNYYIIKGKERLEEVANSYRISLDELLRINNLKNSRDIYPGQILYFEENEKQNGESEGDK
ncbi:LysM domain-containing protein [uncultured Cetobacterium sp.]|uniref:LysM peptidoglycan-binding domain-containing protein n=1 Tax=uncultured Cetobacterium sp. TaxID=527638 RepID=UPI0026380512|nr:LysM domain-containing protein [uncultured Cetobacterium sp.]